MTQPVVGLSDSDVDEIVEDTFTIAGVEGDADAVLAHLRTRLLDLSLTNRLLQFRHGTRSVRVIDEVPDQVFARLRNGDELELVPVPEPTLDRPGGAKRGNADMVSPNGPPQPRGTVRQVREAAASAHAKELGLSTDFDLTPVARAATPVGRRPGKCVQTPLFPADLESSLRAIASEARSAIEEKGSNVLYLVFGFLEWFEADASDKPVLSPLLMLPVVLRRGDPDRKTGAYRFFISYSGEDILPNISLQERLRRDFGIDLPDMEDDESPETYARRIQDTVPLLARWTLRRQVSLGLLLFTKLLMYKDLDPTSWPAGSAPTKHPRLLDLFQGGGGGRDEFAREYHFDADDHAASAIPPIIMDADSSQHSAIVDVIAGRSMVIEGPPGTGKSQTIANLIAAAMGEGKTVLFIADKLTALEVVRKRLDGAGLGLFCLELHSDKTQKAWLMEDLRRRLDRRNTFSPPAALDAQLSMVNEARHALNIYAKSVNAPFGRLGWTIYDILWGTQRRRSRLGGLADRWSTTILRDAEKLDLSRYEEMCRVAEAFTSSVTNVRSFGELHRHPFWGMWPEAVTSDTEAQTSRALVALHDGVVNADARIAAAESELGAPMPRTLADMQRRSAMACSRSTQSTSSRSSTRRPAACSRVASASAIPSPSTTKAPSF